MAKITKEIALKVEKIARKLTSNSDEFYDSLQEGLTKVCEMVNGHTESYYVQYAYRRIQNYLKKTRKNIKRDVSMENEMLDNLEDKSANPLYGGKKTTVPSYDD